jgi:hypothetical protein
VETKMNRASVACTVLVENQKSIFEGNPMVTKDSEKVNKSSIFFFLFSRGVKPNSVSVNDIEKKIRQNQRK